MQKIKLFIAVPCYKWPPDIHHAMSVQALMDHPGFEAEYQAVVGDAHIERARAVLLAEYLDQRKTKKFDFFLNIDNDIEFRADDVYHMCMRNEPVIGGPYSYRSDADGKKDQIVVRPLPNQKPTDDYMVQVRYLGGGFTMLRNDVIDRLMMEHPELRFKENPDMHDPPRFTYALWNPILIDRPDWEDTEGAGAKELLSEDYSLCERLNNLGYKCMLDLRVILTHWHGGIPFRLPSQAIKDEEFKIEAD